MYKRQVLVSMAAGLQLDRLAQMLGRPAPMLRIMPNTPVAIGQGMIPVSYTHLDVYKRQPTSRPRPHTSRPRPLMIRR